MSEHYSTKIAEAPLIESPFPHIVVDDFFPADLYCEMISARPAPGAFGTRNFGHIRLTADHDPIFEPLPDENSRFWLDINATWENVIGPNLCDRFLPRLTNKLDNMFGADWRDVIGDTPLPAAERFRVSPLIMQCRRPGNEQAPHMDNATSLFSAIFYLGDLLGDSRDGLTLYAVRNGARLTEAYRRKAAIRSWHPDPIEFGFEPARIIDYCPNRMIAFLSSAHSIHSVKVEHTSARYSMQGQCPIPPRIGDRLFAQWTDVLAHTGRTIYM